MPILIFSAFCGRKILWNVKGKRVKTDTLIRLDPMHGSKTVQKVVTIYYRDFMWYHKILVSYFNATKYIARFLLTILWYTRIYKTTISNCFIIIAESIS